ncbi:undecaprenyl-phosphate glucose phosphotransferase [Paenibacillus sp. 2RAB27]|uniref:undecaprenyl-phosphate glucose phosphotransferase n=1 Tax=Paenibacillus sp. 2RAB27 TaxID=3232991 RepID=UPI003F9B5954
MVRGNQKFLTQVYSFADLIFVELSFLFAWWLKFESDLISYEPFIPFNKYVPWSFVYGLIAIGFGYLTSLYSSKRKKSFSFEFFKVVQVHIISLLILVSILFLFKEVDISRHFLAIFLIANISFILIYRYFLNIILKLIRAKGYNKKFILILGAGSLGKKFNKSLVQHPELGFEVIGFLDDFQNKHELLENNIKPILGSIDDLEIILQKTLVDEVIIALPLVAYQKYEEIVNVCEKYGIKVMIIPDFFDFLPAKPYFDNFAGMPLINIRDIPLDEMGNKLLKRSFDIVFSLLVIIMILPILIIIAVFVKLTSPGPVIFRQERVGLNRRKFMMYKFRSMKALPPEIVDTGWTIQNDPRKTKFGSFLRKTSLDELPQFFNVLFGHMSVVGPRPERPHFVEQFKGEIPKYMVKHHIRPGITGWAQSNGLRGDTSITDRIKHDIFYIENWSFLFDIKIICKTIINGFINKNAY